jgi:ABC-type xylose transport system permease subunit
MGLVQKGFHFAVNLFRMGLGLFPWIVGRAIVGAIIGGSVAVFVSGIFKLAIASPLPLATPFSIGALAGLLVGALVGLVRGVWIVVREVRNEVLKDETWDTEREGW